MSVFQKRHYRAIALILRGLSSELSDKAHKLLVEEFEKAFARDNPTFERARFSDESGVS